MPNPIGNFAQIEEFDRSLAFVGARAEANFAVDPNTALNKTRRVAERLAAVVAERSGIELSAGEAFVDTLRKVQSAGVLPRELTDALHRVSKAAPLDERLLAKAFLGELVREDPFDEPASVLLARARSKPADGPKRRRKARP